MKRDISAMSNAKRIRMFARIISYIMKSTGNREMRIPISELSVPLPDVGLVVEGDTLVIALGDDPKAPAGREL